MGWKLAASSAVREADMTRGPAGYGRYDDDPAHVGCPWAGSDMSPCVARDGRLGLHDCDLDDEPAVCAGCWNTPEFLAEDLGEEYGPARALRAAGDPVTLADELAAMVREATEPGRGS